MGITLAQLETFVRVAAHGHFTRVAEELALTQPAVTRQMQTLERHFGVPLIEMVGHQPELTDAGRFLASRAHEVLAQTAALEREMRAFAEIQRGTLYLGATHLTGTFTLPSLLARFRHLYPGIHLQVEIADCARLVDQVRLGELSLALAEGNVAREDIACVPYATDRLVLVVPPSHPFVQRPAVTFADLVSEPLIWDETAMDLRAWFSQRLSPAGGPPHAILEFPGGEGVIRAVEAGLGIALLSSLVVAQALTEQRLVPVEVAGLDIQRPLQLLTRRQRALSPASLALKRLVVAESPAHPSCES